MALEDWPVKFRFGEICVLDKDGKPTRVEIEGVSIRAVRKLDDCDVIYDVREEGNRIAYLANQKHLAKLPRK